jgi:hypothetical protein
MSTRTLTVSTLFRPLRWKTQFVPFLRIAGNWFQMAGFNPGDKVTVSVEDGALVIRPFREPHLKTV